MLLDDANAVKLGTTPVIRMMKAGVEVWPKTPVALTATATAWDQVALTIIPPMTGADSYVLKRDGVVIPGYNGTALTYTDTGRFPSTTYVYTVDAMRGATVQSSGVALERTPSRADMGLTTSAPYWDTITISWTDSSGGAGISYRLKRGSTVIYTGTAKTYSDASVLLPSTSYTYTLEALRDSTVISTDTSTRSTPAHADMGLALNGAVAWNSVKLKWTDTAQRSIDWYKLYRGSTEINSASSATKSDTDNPGAGTYTYKLVAYRGGTSGTRIVPDDTLSVTVPTRTYSTAGVNGPGTGGYSWTECTQVGLTGPNFSMAQSGYIYQTSYNCSGYTDGGRFNPKLDGAYQGWFACGSIKPYPTSYWSVATIGTPGVSGLWAVAGTHTSGADVGGDCNKTQWYGNTGGAYQSTIAMGTTSWWWWNAVERDNEMRTQPWWNESLAGRAIDMESWMDVTGATVAVVIHDGNTGELLVEWGTVPIPPVNPPDPGGLPPDVESP